MLAARLTRYVLENRFRGVQRFPVVLLLKPTLRRNIPGGVMRESSGSTERDMSVDECLASVNEAGAPVVCVSGGEPLLHPGIDEIVNGVISGQRFAYLYTNGLIAEGALGRFKPSPRFGWVFHLDGMAETHDRISGHAGLFETVILAIQAAKRSGFQVYTDTTVYKGVTSAELQMLFELLSRLKVDGLMVAPACACEGVASEACPSREETIQVFQRLYEKRRDYPFHSTPPYLEFLAGRRELPCVPWSTLTRDPAGWKQPCDMMADAHVSSLRELMEDTDWAKYGVGKDGRCASCLAQCGFEAGALEATAGGVSGFWKLIRWNWLGV